MQFRHYNTIEDMVIIIRYFMHKRDAHDLNVCLMYDGRPTSTSNNKVVIVIYCYASNKKESHIILYIVSIIIKSCSQNISF